MLKKRRRRKCAIKYVREIKKRSPGRPKAGLEPVHRRIIRILDRNTGAFLTTAEFCAIRRISHRLFGGFLRRQVPSKGGVCTLSSTDNWVTSSINYARQQRPYKGGIAAVNYLFVTKYGQVIISRFKPKDAYVVAIDLKNRIYINRTGTYPILNGNHSRDGNVPIILEIPEGTLTPDTFALEREIIPREIHEKVYIYPKDSVEEEETVEEITEEDILSQELGDTTDLDEE